jgi:cardiolipin synthase A/B
MHRTTLIKLAVVALAAGYCGSLVPHASPAASSGPTDAILAVHDSPRAAATLRVLTEPAAGIGPIYGLITGARSSVDLTMYELADPTAEADLTAAAARGVDVRVILDRHLERSANTAAYDYLTARGVHVRWGPAGTTYHQKTLTVDGRTSVIMTLNFVASYYRDTRDFAVIDTNRADVAAVVRTFDADFSGTAVTPPDGTDLVWSPTNAQSSVLSVISGATRTLAVEEEEMADPAVTALASAARRGVNVTVTMTADSEWDPAFNQLAAAGVHIRLYRDSSRTLYIHAKAIVADAGRSDQRVLVGSQNFSVASLDYNRELGILTSASAVVKAVAATLAGDYAGAAPYAAGPAPQPPAESGFWCTADAVVYSAAYHENNVYVKSDLRYQEVTATTGGYVSTTQTNGFGSALIFLDGPSPGVTITVKVGRATCTTRD